MTETVVTDIIPQNLERGYLVNRKLINKPKNKSHSVLDWRLISPTRQAIIESIKDGYAVLPSLVNLTELIKKQEASKTAPKPLSVSHNEVTGSNLVVIDCDANHYHENVLSHQLRPFMFFVYPSPSATMKDGIPDRYRIFIELDTEVDKQQLAIVRKAVINFFEQPDYSCFNVARLFYGCNKYQPTIENIDAPKLPLSFLEDAIIEIQKQQNERSRIDGIDSIYKESLDESQFKIHQYIWKQLKEKYTDLSLNQLVDLVFTSYPSSEDMTYQSSRHDSSSGWLLSEHWSYPKCMQDTPDYQQSGGGFWIRCNDIHPPIGTIIGKNKNYDFVKWHLYHTQKEGKLLGLDPDNSIKDYQKVIHSFQDKHGITRYDFRKKDVDAISGSALEEMAIELFNSVNPNHLMIANWEKASTNIHYYHFNGSIWQQFARFEAWNDLFKPIAIEKGWEEYLTALEGKVRRLINVKWENRLDKKPEFNPSRVPFFNQLVIPATGEILDNDGLQYNEKTYQFEYLPDINEDHEDIKFLQSFLKDWLQDDFYYQTYISTIVLAAQLQLYRTGLVILAIGDPNCGKSTMVKFINAITTPFSVDGTVIMSGKGQFDSEPLSESVSVITAEDIRLNAENILFLKRCFGQSDNGKPTTIMVGRKNKSQLPIRRTFGAVFDCQDMPNFGNDLGIERRFIVLKFTREKHYRPDLLSDIDRFLRIDPSIVVSWAMKQDTEQHLKFIQDALHSDIQKQLKQYVASNNDPIVMAINDVFDFTDNEDDILSLKAMVTAIEVWGRDNSTPIALKRPGTVINKILNNPTYNYPIAGRRGVKDAPDLIKRNGQTFRGFRYVKIKEEYQEKVNRWLTDF